MSIKCPKFQADNPDTVKFCGALASNGLWSVSDTNGKVFEALRKIPDL